jgi:hypothetical protein
VNLTFADKLSNYARDVTHDEGMRDEEREKAEGTKQ